MRRCFEEVNTRRRSFLSQSKLERGPQEFNSRQLPFEASRNKCENVWEKREFNNVSIPPPSSLLKHPIFMNSSILVLLQTRMIEGGNVSGVFWESCNRTSRKILDTPNTRILERICMSLLIALACIYGKVLTVEIYSQYTRKNLDLLEQGLRRWVTMTFQLCTPTSKKSLGWRKQNARDRFGRFYDTYCIVKLWYSLALRVLSETLWSSCFARCGPKGTR